MIQPTFTHGVGKTKFHILTGLSARGSVVLQPPARGSVVLLSPLLICEDAVNE